MCKTIKEVNYILCVNDHECEQFIEPNFHIGNLVFRRKYSQAKINGSCTKRIHVNNKRRWKEKLRRGSESQERQELSQSL